MDHISFLEENIFTALNHLNDKSLPSIFEYYCSIFLSKKHNENFYVWKDICPSIKENLNAPTNDKGIDISNESFTNLNQVKYYGEDSIICYSKLSTFLAFGTFFPKNIRDNISYSLLRTDHSKLSKHVKHFVSIGNLNDYPISKETFLHDIQAIKQRYQNRLIKYEEEEFKLRPPQIESLKLLERSELEKKNCIIQLPTGIGKTALFIEYIKKNDGKFLVLVPTLVLLGQWFEELKINKIKKVYKIGTYDNNSFTDKELNDHKVVLCVFNSFYLVKNYVQAFKKVCVDEAHNIFRPDIYIDDYEDVEDNNNEDTYMESIRRSFKDNVNFLLMSATIDSIEECLYYSYNIRDGIEDGYLTDYQLILPIFDDDPSDTNIAEYLVRKGELHCIIYASSIEECESFTGILNGILPNSAAFIHSGVSEKVRKSVIKRFNESRIRFLVNVRVLSEGFNSEICSSICFLHLSCNDTFIIQSIGRSLRLYEGKKVSNIYLPFNKESDVGNFKVFIQQLSNSDERIKRSCKEKNIGGYVNIEMAEKKDESEEKEEDEEKYSNIEYRYDMVYDSVEINEKLSGEEKVKALIEYNKIPKQSEKYTYKEIKFKIGVFWDSIKQGHNQKLYEDYFSKIDIFKQDYERNQKLKEEKRNKRLLKPLDKFEALIEFYKKKERLPIRKDKYTYKDIEFSIGAFFNCIKQGQSKELYEHYLSKIDLFREDYERIQKLKEEKKDKGELTSLEKVEALIEFYKKKERLSKSEEQYTYKDIEFNIGGFWSRIRQGKNKKLYEHYLSKIDLFREDYERIQKLKEENKN